MNQRCVSPLPDRDGDGIAAGADCDDTDPEVGTDFVRSCMADCGRGVERCESGQVEPCTCDTCTDGARTGSETDVDCGGACPPCEDGEGCGAHSDCASGVCVLGECQEPTCTDDVANGGETGADCGGETDCPRCGGGEACGAGTDCESGICAEEESCTAPAYSWDATNWSVCDATCGIGTQTRTVECRRADGTVVDDSMCTGTRPEESRTCSAMSGCAWFTGTYGACSSTCGNGTQTRTVECRDSAGTAVPDAWCTETKPATSQDCSDMTGCEWVTGEWSACSKNCDTGDQSRTVECSDGSQAVPDSWCPDPKPVTSRTCNTEPCCEDLLTGDLRNWNGGNHVEFYNPDLDTAMELCSVLTGRTHSTSILNTGTASSDGWAPYSNLCIDYWDGDAWSSVCASGSACVGRDYISHMRCCNSDTSAP